MHVGGDFRQRRDVAKEPEDTAWTEGVADALIHAVAARDLHVAAVDFDPTDHEGDDDEVGTVKRRPAVVRGLDGRAESVVTHHFPRPGGVALGPFEVDVHQAVLRALECREREQIAHQSQGECHSTGPDHRDLRGPQPGIDIRSLHRLGGDRGHLVSPRGVML